VVSSSQPVITTISAAEIAIGSGVKMWNDSSTSALALDSSSPVEWRRCQDIGSAR
jgi:hypothetical protein